MTFRIEIKTGRLVSVLGLLGIVAGIIFGYLYLAGAIAAALGGGFLAWVAAVIFAAVAGIFLAELAVIVLVWGGITLFGLLGLIFSAFS